MEGRGGRGVCDIPEGPAGRSAESAVDDLGSCDVPDPNEAGLDPSAEDQALA